MPKKQEKISSALLFQMFPVIIVFTILGMVIFLLIANVQLPSEGLNFLSLGHVSVLPVVVVLLVPSVMIIMLSKNTQQSKRILLSVISLVAVYSLVFYYTHSYVNLNGNIKYDTWRIMYAVGLVPLLAALPSLWMNRTKASISVAKMGSDCAFLASAVMWLFPLFTELLLWLEWFMQGTFDTNTNGTALGGAGFNDFVFVPGFATISAALIILMLLKLVKVNRQVTEFSLVRD